MKKVKVIFPDGSTADINESELQDAIKAGAKLATEKASKKVMMSFPDGSTAEIDESEIEGAESAGAIKKKEVGSVPSNGLDLGNKESVLGYMQSLKTPTTNKEYEQAIAKSKPLMQVNKAGTLITNEATTDLSLPKLSEEELAAHNQQKIKNKIDNVTSRVYDGSATIDDLNSISGLEEAKPFLTDYLNVYADKDKLPQGDVLISGEHWNTAVKNSNFENRGISVKQIDNNVKVSDQIISSLSGSKLNILKIFNGTMDAFSGPASTDDIDLPQIDANNPDQISDLIKKISQSNSLTDASGENISDKRQDILAALNYKLDNIKRTEKIDAEIEALDSKIANAIGDIEQDVTEITSADPTARTPNTDERKITAFKRGLNYVKSSDPATYRNVIRGIDNKEQIAESDYQSIVAKGQQLENFNTFIAGATNKELIGAETNFNLETKSSKIAKTSGVFGEFFKQAGISKGHFSDEDIDYATKQIDWAAYGMTQPTEKELNFIKSEEDRLFYDQIPKNGGFFSFVKGAETPFLAIARTAQDVTSGSTSTDYLRSKELNRAGSGGQLTPDKKGQYGQRLASDRDNIWYDVLEGAGAFVPQILLTRGLGAPFSGAAQAAVSTVPRAALTAEQLFTINTATGTLLSSYLQSYGDGYEMALQNTGDPIKAQKIGAIGGIIDGVMEQWLPETKIGRSIVRNLRGDVSEKIAAIIRKGGDPADILKGTKNLLKPFVAQYLNVTGQEMAEEGTAVLLKQLTETIVSPETAATNDVMSDLGQTLWSTALQTFIPAIASGGGSSKNRFTQKVFNEAAIKYDYSVDALKKSLLKGTIDQDEFNKSISLLSTHRNSIANAPKEDADGGFIPAKDRNEFAYQETRIKINEEKIKAKGISDVQKEVLEQKIKESQDIQRSILMPEEVEIKPDQSSITKQAIIAAEEIPGKDLRAAFLLDPDAGLKEVADQIKSSNRESVVELYGERVVSIAEDLHPGQDISAGVSAAKLSTAEYNKGDIVKNKEDVTGEIFSQNKGGYVVKVGDEFQTWSKDDIAPQPQDKATASTDQELISFAKERKAVNDLFDLDWEGKSDAEIKSIQDRNDVVEEKGKDVFEKYATPEEKKEYEKLGKRTIGEKLKKDKYSAFRRQNNYREDVLDRITKGLSDIEKQPKDKATASTDQKVGSELKVTDESYKDIPSQKLEYKDGTAFVHKDSEGGKEHLFISRVDVADKGKGTGSEFLTKIEDYAKENNLDQIATIPETDASRKFFEKNGFVDKDGMMYKDLQAPSLSSNTPSKPASTVLSRGDAGSVGVGGDVKNILDKEAPILENDSVLKTDGLPDLEIVSSKEVGSALESEIGSDKGVIDDKVRYIPVKEFDYTHNKRSKQIAEQISENGWIEPLIVSFDKDGNLYTVEGQHRGAALQELGYDKAPVRVIYDKNDFEVKTNKNGKNNEPISDNRNGNNKESVGGGTNANETGGREEGTNDSQLGNKNKGQQKPTQPIAGSVGVGVQSSNQELKPIAEKFGERWGMQIDEKTAAQIKDIIDNNEKDEAVNKLRLVRVRLQNQAASEGGGRKAELEKQKQKVNTEYGAKISSIQNEIEKLNEENDPEQVQETGLIKQIDDLEKERDDKLSEIEAAAQQQFTDLEKADEAAYQEATKKVIGAAPHVTMEAAGRTTAYDAKQQLQDSGVVFDKPLVKGVKTNDLHEFGFGPAMEAQLNEILTGPNYTQRQRGMAAAYMAALRLLNNNPNNFIGRLFSRTTEKNETRIRIAYDTRTEKAMPAISVQNGVVSINAYKLGEMVGKFGGEKRFLSWVETALQEEVIHLAANHVASAEDIQQVADEMTLEQKKKVRELYDPTGDMTEYQVAQEYLRMIYQEKAFGVTTEMMLPEPGAISAFRRIAVNLMNFIKKAFAGADNPKAQQILRRLDSFIKGKEVWRMGPAGTERLAVSGNLEGDKKALNLQQTKQDANDIITGKKVFERFSQEEQYGLAEGGQIHVEASTILGTNEGTSGSAEAQEKLIEDYARERGIWVNNTDTELRKQYGKPISELDIDKNHEASVWRKDDNTVVKSQNTAMYGFDLQQKLDGITLQNTRFPEALIKVIGFGRDKRGDFQVIVEQQFIDGTKTTQEEINAHLNKMGFEKDLDNNQFTDKDGQTIIEDVHRANAIKTPEGNIVVIDPIMRLNTPEQGYGGTRKISNRIVGGGERLAASEGGDDFGDLYDEFKSKQEGKKKIRITAEEFQKMSDEAKASFEKELNDMPQDEQSEATESYQYGGTKYNPGNDPIANYNLITTKNANSKYETEITASNVFGEDMTSTDRFAALVGMRDSGQEMIALAQQMFGGADVDTYGGPLLDYIRKMATGDPKKAILLGTLLGEIKNKIERSGSRELQPMYDQAFYTWKMLMHQMGQNLATGRLLRLFRDGYMSDIYWDVIMEENESKDLRELQKSIIESEVTSEDYENYKQSRQKGKSAEEVNTDRKNTKAKKDKKQAQDSGKKKKPKEAYEKKYAEKEKEVQKKHGNKDSLYNLIKKKIDEIKDKCK